VVSLNKSAPKLDAQIAPTPPPVAPTPVAAPRRTLRVESTPSGATVQAGEKVLGVTPLSMDVDPTQLPSPLTLTLSAPGFAAQEVTPTPNGDAWVARAQLQKLEAEPAAKPVEAPKKSSHPAAKKPTTSKPAGYKDDPYGD
jgi:hypothetical protein